MRANITSLLWWQYSYLHIRWWSMNRKLPHGYLTKIQWNHSGTLHDQVTNSWILYHWQAAWLTFKPWTGNNLIIHIQNKHKYYPCNTAPKLSEILPSTTTSSAHSLHMTVPEFMLSMVVLQEASSIFSQGQMTLYNS